MCCRHWPQSRRGPQTGWGHSRWAQLTGSLWSSSGPLPSNLVSEELLKKKKERKEVSRFGTQNNKWRKTQTMPGRGKSVGVGYVMFSNSFSMQLHICWRLQQRHLRLSLCVSLKFDKTPFGRSNKQVASCYSNMGLFLNSSPTSPHQSGRTCLGTSLTLTGNQPGVRVLHHAVYLWQLQT